MTCGEGGTPKRRLLIGVLFVAVCACVYIGGQSLKGVTFGGLLYSSLRPR